MLPRPRATPSVACGRWLVALALVVAHPIAAAFGFDDVAQIAERNAARAYVAPAARLPDELARLDYDGLRDIRYRPDRAIWRAQGLPFELQFFHLGQHHTQPVDVHEVHDGRARRFDYDPDAWAFGRRRFDRSGWRGLGHAGFRVHYALNDAGYKDELIVFLGASYFRALGRGQQYGLSARALAIDTVGGTPATGGEEFPRFTGFWIERPARDARALTIHALLDSPRATAAATFVVTPGDSTVVQTRLRVWARAGAAPIAMLGVAPLTSMYLHGENQPQAVDFRPEVHDSDGLAIAGRSDAAATASEWIWRPLVNPPADPYTPLAPSFALARLDGFGLLQRDRRAAAYEDPEARYERRPSAWVEPIGDWGPGRVQLLLLPTPDETEDNVVAAWVPARPLVAGRPLEFAYRLHWQGDALTAPPHGHTVQTRRGRGWAKLAHGEVQHVVDFDGPALRALPANAALKAVATSGSGGRVTHAHAYPLPQGGWRLQLRVQRDDAARPLELRAFLEHAGRALTETWAALLPPEPTALRAARANAP